MVEPGILILLISIVPCFWSRVASVHRLHFLRTITSVQPNSRHLGVLCDHDLSDNLHCDEAFLVAIGFGQATGLPVTSERCARAMLDDFCEHLASLIPAECRIPTGMPLTAMERRLTNFQQMLSWVLRRLGRILLSTPCDD